MCLLTFALNVHPTYPFLMIANRDEFYDRPTQSLHQWREHPDIWGGRDLKAAGTWMAMAQKGKFAAVTNYRDPKNINPDARSRGELVTAFLQQEGAALPYMETIKKESRLYNGFNLLTMDIAEMSMLHFSNYEGKINVLHQGVFGLSNALLDTPWPKLTRLKQTFEQRIRDPFEPEDLICLLEDRTPAPDHELPKTGVPIEWERVLSSVCIQSEGYGTCSHTVLAIDRDKHVSYIEKTRAVGGRVEEIKKIAFDCR